MVPPTLEQLHEYAMSTGQQGYIDPVSKLFVMTCATLKARGTCCENGCRHCPFPVLEPAGAKSAEPVRS